MNVYKEADGLFVAGNYAAAADKVRSDAKPTVSTAHLLDWLYIGSGDFAAAQHAKAVADFMSAEACLKQQDMRVFGGTFSGSDYLARTYDETMMNFYQALSYLAGDRIDRESWTG